MSKLQTVAFWLLILVLVLTVIFFWGSIASVVAVVGLGYAGIVYLWNRFIIVDRENDFDDEQ